MDGAITPRVRARAILDRDDWDAIVIGSGAGGLVCAALLAICASMRVLVLERHYEPGGLTQTFRRRRFAWDIGVHYIGDVAPGSILRRIFDVASDGEIDWVRLPARHDHLIAPGFDARLGGDREALRAQLREHAPGEERAIDRILGEIEECARASKPTLLARMREGEIDARSSRAPFHRWAARRSIEVLEDAGASPRLASLFTYTWTDYGAPPERSSFAALAMATAHYFSGAFYPVGGGARIAHALARAIDRRGGALVVCAPASEILVRDRRAVGVRLDDGREILAPIVISGAGARTTFEHLVREDTETRARVRAIGPSEAHVGLYLGIAGSPREHRLDGSNLWLRRDPLGESACDAAAWARGERSEPPELFASTACAIDPSYGDRYPGRTAITAAVAVPSESFAEWRGSERGKRGERYEELKTALGHSMMRMLAPHLPLDAIEHIEVSTPLSTAHFAGHANGEVGGLDATPLRLRTAPGPHTEIAGLYLTGQDVWLCGVGGAASGAVLTACAITKRDLVRELAVRA
jgi:all-trans-retinol 13,14-reductase